MYLPGLYHLSQRRVWGGNLVNEMLMYIMKSRDSEEEMIDHEEEVPQKIISKTEDKPKILSQS